MGREQAGWPGHVMAWRGGDTSYPQCMLRLRCALSASFAFVCRPSPQMAPEGEAWSMNSPAHCIPLRLLAELSDQMQLQRSMLNLDPMGS